MSRHISVMASWVKNPIKGVLLDITGVLYESGADKAIEGSVEAIERLRKASVPFRFVTNETQRTRQSLVNKLQRFGFTLSENEVFACAPAVKSYLQQKHLRPHLLVHPDVLPDFEGCDTNSPNCVVVGDAAERFTYENMNEAFHLLLNNKESELISMGKGRYYKEGDQLVLDLGPFTVALEFACDKKAKVIGKPSADFFNMALTDLNIKPEEAVMIGDDIQGDVKAAQDAGLRGVQVRTGKFRPSDENHPTVKPDGIVDNLKQAVDAILEARKCS